MQMCNNIQRIIKYKLEQLMIDSPKDDCYMCGQNISDFVTLVSHSLYGKYSSSQNFYFTKQINEILQQAISPVYIQFQDNNYYDNDDEYMKRIYNQHEFPKKIQMLSEYYKFHRDLPVWNERNIETTMGKYYNRLKDVDYKKIKSVLKKQQGISLTTHKSFSSLDDSEYTKKSRYSTMLNDLSSSNDSLLLKDMCQKIGKALKKVKVENIFKGSYYSGQKKFEEYLKKNKKRKQNHNLEAENRKQGLGFRKMKYNPKLITKNDEPGLKQVIFVSNHSIKERKYLAGKNAISGEKTTANQTISREEKTKRQKSRQNLHTSSRHSLARKGSTLKNPFCQDLLHASIKPIKGSKIISLINNQNFKTVNQIYRPIERNEKKQKIQSGQLSRKYSSKQLVTRLKFRSNSQQCLPTTTIMKRDPSKNKLATGIKTKRSPKKYTISVAGKQEEGENEERNKILTARQNSHRMLRANSTDKLGIQNQKQYKTNKVRNQKLSSKRSSAIEQLLEQKLNVLKRKPLF